MTIKTEALWDEDATQEEQIDLYQHLVNTGDAWRLEGHVGRTAMGLIESGQIMLGRTGHRDYWGNYVPGREQVAHGTKGSLSFVVQHVGEAEAQRRADIV